MAALDYRSLFPEEMPRFTPPQLSPAEASIENILRDFQRVSEDYFSQREEMLRELNQRMREVLEIAERYSLHGGPPTLEELLDITGKHLARAKSEIEPQIEAARQSRKQSARSKHLKVREVMTSLADRNIHLMRDYIKASEDVYYKLARLRDEAVRRSFEPLAMEALAGAWGNDDEY